MDIETLKRANDLTETIAKVVRQLKYWESSYDFTGDLRLKIITEGNHTKEVYVEKKLCKLYKHKSCRYLEVEKQVSYFRTRI